MSTKARSAFGSFMVQAVAHCGMECKFKQLNVRAEKVFLTLRSLRYARRVQSLQVLIKIIRSYSAEILRLTFFFSLFQIRRNFCKLGEGGLEVFDNRAAGTSEMDGKPEG